MLIIVVLNGQTNRYRSAQAYAALSSVTVSVVSKQSGLISLPCRFEVCTYISACAKEVCVMIEAFFPLSLSTELGHVEDEIFKKRRDDEVTGDTSLKVLCVCGFFLHEQLRVCVPLELTSHSLGAQQAQDITRVALVAKVCILFFQLIPNWC